MTGRYEIGDEIGRGATSVVHRGRDLRLGRDVAIKVLRSDHDHDPAYRARFRRQAADAAVLNHPAIVAVYDTGELPEDEGGEPFVVMELVDGRTLRAELAADGSPVVRRAIEVAADVCAALDFSHKHGILHRSVCPENVMVDGAGAIKVMDFGMSQPSLARRSAGYLAPEQARGESVDARTDIYGTGCVLYELLTGSVPFDGPDPVEIAYRQVGEPPRPPSDLAPAVPGDLDAIVLKALEKDPLDRYQSAADLRSDLVRALVGAPLPVAAGRSGQTRDVTSVQPRNPSPPLLAPPTRTRPPDETEPAPSRRPRRVASFVGFGVISAVALAAAVWFTTAVLTAPPPARLIAVPDLSGMTVAAARSALADKGLTVGTLTDADSPPGDLGKVLAQRPSGQTEVTGGTPINLVVGHGVSAVTVPDLTGLTSDEARTEVSGLGLTYVQQQQPSSDADKGKVTDQSPAALDQLAPGSTVTVTVGTGLTMVTVPDGIVGIGVDDATAVLAGAGLTAVGVEQDGTAPSNQVIGSDYAPGQRIPEGSPVTLNYSNNSLMVMPDLVGRSQDAAAGILQDLGWAGDAGAMSVTSAPASTANLIGAVVTQQPAAGAVVRKLGTPVTVGVGVKQITMPALIGQTRAVAENRLKAAGATAVTFADGGTAPRGQSGRVAAQSVPGGTAITADTPVVVVVYD